DPRVVEQLVSRAAIVSYDIVSVASVEKIGIISTAAGERVVAPTTAKHIVAACPTQNIVGAVADERIIEPIACSIDGTGSIQCKIFHVGTEGIGHAGLNRIRSPARGLHHRVTRTHNVDIVTGSSG